MPDLTTLIQSVLDIADGIKSAELKHAIAELKIQAADLLTENHELREQLKMLQDEKEKPLIFKEGFYYSADDADNKYPFCPACYDASKQRIHLKKLALTLRCPNPKCNNDYYEPPRKVRTSGLPNP
jgi:hypothetical protein